MDNYLNSSLFNQYSPLSNEITLRYSLTKYICDEQDATLNENEFSSIVQKNNFDGYITISKHSTLKDIKIEINKKTGFPINTMVGFGYWLGETYDENGKKWENFRYYNINENTLILHSRYNNEIITKRYVYIFIDTSEDEIFLRINENQIINDKTIGELKEKEKKNKKKISKLELKMNELTSENYTNKIKISNITKENKRLTEINDKVQEERRKHEKDSKDCNDKFKIEKNNIKDKMITDWEKEISKILIKNYINKR